MRARLLAIVLAAIGIAACQQPAAPMDADQVLRRMSDKLAAASRFGVTARREVDADLLHGRDLQPQTSIKARVVRPNRIAVELEGSGEKRAIYSDGNSFTLQDIRKNLYSTAKLKTSLDDLGQQLERLYGFAPPMAEFVTSNPYDSIRARVSNLTYLGLADAGGIKCHRLSATGEVADAELFVGADDFLPRQLIATFRTMESKPQIRLYFSAWDLTPSWSDAELAFTPPAGAKQIPMRSVAEMQALMGDKAGKGK